MSSRSRLTDSHHSTLHAVFLAAKESGYTEFKLRLVTSPKGRVEFCLSPREHSEMSAKFEVRGNMARAAASDASVVPADDTDFGIYGGTRSGEAPSGFTVPIGTGEHAGILLNVVPGALALANPVYRETLAR